MRETNIDIRGGHSQVNPAATQAIQNNYYGSPIPIQDTDTPRTVVVPANRYAPSSCKAIPPVSTTTASSSSPRPASGQPA